MTREELNELAQKAGFGANQRATLRLKLQHFAALVAAAERDACKEICVDDGALGLAAAIRARSEE